MLKFLDKKILTILRSKYIQNVFRPMEAPKNLIVLYFAADYSSHRHLTNISRYFTWTRKMNGMHKTAKILFVLLKYIISKLE